MKLTAKFNFFSDGKWPFKLVTTLLSFSIFFSSCQPVSTAGEGGWSIRRPNVITRQYSPVIDFICDGGQPWDDHQDDSSSVPPFIPEQPKDYCFRKDDEVEISVLYGNESELRSTIVAPDGHIYFANLPPTLAEDRSLNDVAEEIKQKLKVWYLDPYVTLAPIRSVDRVFKIFGRVTRPGVYPIEEKLTLRQAIGIGGGMVYENDQNKEKNKELFSLVDLNKSYIVREGKKLDVDFEVVVKGADPIGNMEIFAGDFIYLAPSENYEVYVLGNVRVPHAVPWTSKMTLTGALGQAGGWSELLPQSADLTRVTILRDRMCDPKLFNVNLAMILAGQGRNFYLHPEDIIFVHNKQIRYGRELMRIIINTFLQAFLTGAASNYANAFWFPIPVNDDTTDGG